MSENERARILEAIGRVIVKLKKYQGRTVGEQNTKASLIDPLVEALGWDTGDLDEVHREYKARPSDKPVDYALQLLRKPRLFIEAKGLGEDLTERRWVSQVLSYATVAGVAWCVLSDGDEYRFYNATAPIDAEEKLFCRIRLSEDSPDDVANTLNLISKANLEGTLLDDYWKSHFVDRRVNAALRQLLTVADGGLIRLIRKHSPELSPREVADSVLRLNVQIEPPPAWNARPKRDAEAQTRTRVPRGKTPRVKKGKKQFFSVTLKEILDSRILDAPLRLFRKYKKQVLEATLLRDGTVEFNGKTYDTCSAAAEYARATIMGRRMNTNGWQFWQYMDSAGKKRELVEARSAYISAQART